MIQTYVESKVEGLDDQLRKMKTQVDDLTRTNSELVNTRNRLTTENGELQRQLRDLENNYGSFSKNRTQLQTQLDDAKSKLEEEIRVIQLLQLTTSCRFFSLLIIINLTSQFLCSTLFLFCPALKNIL